MAKSRSPKRRPLNRSKQMTEADVENLMTRFAKKHEHCIANGGDKFTGRSRIHSAAKDFEGSAEDKTNPDTVSFLLTPLSINSPRENSGDCKSCHEVFSTKESSIVAGDCPLLREGQDNSETSQQNSCGNDRDPRNVNRATFIDKNSLYSRYYNPSLNSSNECFTTNKDCTFQKKDVQNTYEAESNSDNQEYEVPKNFKLNLGQTVFPTSELDHCKDRSFALNSEMESDSDLSPRSDISNDFSPRKAMNESLDCSAEETPCCPIVFHISEPDLHESDNKTVMISHSNLAVCSPVKIPSRCFQLNKHPFPDAKKRSKSFTLVLDESFRRCDDCCHPWGSSSASSKLITPLTLHMWFGVRLWARAFLASQSTHPQLMLKHDLSVKVPDLSPANSMDLSTTIEATSALVEPENLTPINPVMTGSWFQRFQGLMSEAAFKVNYFFTRERW